MPLFKCEKCGCIENTAISSYWEALHSKTEKLCSECGEPFKWHGSFPKRGADESGYKADANGFLHSPVEIATDPKLAALRDCPYCSHSISDHRTTLFGQECSGRDWHDDSSYRCQCTGDKLQKKEPEDDAT